MRTIRIMLLLLAVCGAELRSARPQSLSFSFWDLFGQPSKMRKIMKEQALQIRLYTSALNTGYHITKDGMKLAHSLKEGEFNLHTAYFNSLEQVNPLIRNHPKGKAIAGLESRLNQALRDEGDWQQKQNLLNPNEMTYFRKVRENLQDKCRLDMEELLLVLTPGKLQLTDAERLVRLDRLYERMKDKQAFALAFTATCRKLAKGRQQQQKEREAVRRLYGIQ